MTPHFNLGDALKSTVAKQRGINNEPTSDTVRQNIKFTAVALEQVHWLVGLITSWYRSPNLNAAVKGASRSDHVNGLAVDFRPAAGYTPMDIVEILRNLQLPYLKQVIIYDDSQHVHVAFKTKDSDRRAEFLVKRNGKYLSLF